MAFEITFLYRGQLRIVRRTANNHAEARANIVREFGLLDGPVFRDYIRVRPLG